MNVAIVRLGSLPIALLLLASCAGRPFLDRVVGITPDCAPSVLREKIAGEFGTACMSRSNCIARLTVFGRESVWEVWHENGTPEMWAELLDCRLRHGRCLEWSIDGSLVREWHYRHGRPHGEQRSWYARSRRLSSRSFWDEGKEIEGVSYDPDGVASALTCGNRRGHVTLGWNRKGELSVCSVFRGDKRIGFSRFGEPTPSDSETLPPKLPGQIDSPALPRLLAKLGHRLGRETESLADAEVRVTNLGALVVWEVWGKDGRPLERAELGGAGVLHGRYQRWGRNAKLLFDCNYDSGRLSGEQRVFHESGGLKCLSIWRDGHEVERETYAENGALSGVALGREEGEGRIDVSWNAAGELVRCTMFRLGKETDFREFGPPPSIPAED